MFCLLLDDWFLKIVVREAFLSPYFTRKISLGHAWLGLGLMQESKRVETIRESGLYLVDVLVVSIAPHIVQFEPFLSVFRKAS